VLEHALLFVGAVSFDVGFTKSRSRTTQNSKERLKTFRRKF